MAGLGDLVQKAFYLGVGIADYAAERAGMTLGELKVQAQKLADEMVARGEMSVEEARKYVDELVKQAEQNVEPAKETQNKSTEPRRIEIISEEEDNATEETEKADDLRKQLETLQEELRRLQRE